MSDSLNERVRDLFGDQERQDEEDQETRRRDR